MLRQQIRRNGMKEKCTEFDSVCLCHSQRKSELNRVRTALSQHTMPLNMQMDLYLRIWRFLTVATTPHTHQSPAAFITISSFFLHSLTSRNYARAHSEFASPTFQPTNQQTNIMCMCNTHVCKLVLGFLHVLLPKDFNFIFIIVKRNERRRHFTLI